ncbi:hypothetical protein ACTQ54_11460 [Fundicoccus sp. Sow4_H7]|uniref:hypothetical protein n=1 Tax=Fundicoccus sp. Sow4_H7 TaxID=3438784 RepID=UPI003F8F96A4
MTNFFDAVSGYGAFPEDVTVTLDSVTETLGESDVFRNNISGDGGLTKAGDGELVFAGDNIIDGDIEIVAAEGVELPEDYNPYN